MALDISNMLCKNVILVDSNYIDKVAFDFSVNFERMLMRQIPQADLALWLDCISLDGEIEPGNNDIEVIFLYKDGTIRNFTPSNLKGEIDGKAFKDNLGEFSMEAYEVASDITTIGEQFTETLQVLLDAKSVEKILIIPDIEEYGNSVKNILSKNKDKQTYLFAIQPQTGNGFKKIQLGFSIVHALGISSDELKD